MTADPNTTPTTAPEKPIVWAVRESRWTSGDEGWAAYTNDGRQITGHLSSDRTWGIHDVGPKFKADRYIEVLGTADPAEIDFRVIPEGEWLPEDVIERGLAAGHLVPRLNDEQGTDTPA